MKKIYKVFLLLLLSLCTFDAKALDVISDEETEVFLQGLIEPIFRAAGIPFKRERIYIVNDDSLNAFVADGNAMFIFTGTIIKPTSQEEIKGVVAHETGHIMGGHILRQKLKAQEMNEVSLASLIAAGAAAALSGRGDVAMAVILGSQSSLMHHYSAYRVQEERSADEAAVKLLAGIGKSPAGMRDFMRRIASQNEMSGISEDSYLRTHPMTTERLSFLDDATNQSPYPIVKTNDEKYQMVKAKLIAYLYDIKRAMRVYPMTAQTKPARYAHAIIYFREFKIDAAIKEIKSLIEEEPDNPYFYEVLGQIYMETGKAALAKEAYRMSLELKPNTPLFQQNLAHAILEDSPTVAEASEIVDMLNKSLIKRPNAFTWLLLSQAYGLKNEIAYANYAAAEYSYLIGALDVAKQQAENAKKASNNPTLTLKIDDLLERLNDIIKERDRAALRRRR